MRRVLLIIGLFISSLFSFSPSAHAQSMQNLQDFFMKGTIVSSQQETGSSLGGSQVPTDLEVKVLDGPLQGKTVAVQYLFDQNGSMGSMGVGTTIILEAKTDPTTGSLQYGVYEQYRLDWVWVVLGAFLIVIVGIARWRGLGSVAGLLVSLGIIGGYIVPQIINGADPLQTCLVGSGIILLITTYIAHGISLRTTLAVVSTGIVLVLAVGLAQLVVHLLQLSGIGNEEIYNLQVGMTHSINPQGLFLGGLLIGTLGALNDITTTQVITVFTLIDEKAGKSVGELFKKGMAIGQEHIASLINTLVLAYAGTSLGVFIFFGLNPMHLPWWVLMNNEGTVEEIVRSVVGSIALILVVPVSTWLAAWIGLQGTRLKDFFPEPKKG